MLKTKIFIILLNPVVIIVLKSNVNHLISEFE